MSRFVHPTAAEIDAHLRRAHVLRSNTVCGFCRRLMRFVLHRSPDRGPVPAPMHLA